MTSMDSLDNESGDISVGDMVKWAESNLKQEIKEARKSQKLIPISGSSDGSKKSELGSATWSSLGSSMTALLCSENSLSASFLRIEDIEMPSSFDNTHRYEEMLCITNDCSFSNFSLVDTNTTQKDLIESKSFTVEQNTPTDLETSKNVFSSSGDLVNFEAEAEKIIDALAEEGGLVSPDQCISVLDLNDLNDSLISGTPIRKKIRDLLQTSANTPRLSTPILQRLMKTLNATLPEECEDVVPVSKHDTFEKKSGQPKNETFVPEPDDAKPVLKMNTTFDKEINLPLPDDTLVLDTKAFKSTDLNATFNQFLTTLKKEGTFTFADDVAVKPKVSNLNTTFEKLHLNSTFDNEPEAEDAPQLDRTFEAAGNGVFIIKGQNTSLIDMESEDLKTVLNSTPLKRGNAHNNKEETTPKTHLKGPLPNLKPSIKSSLLKRLSLVVLPPKSAVGSCESGGGGAAEGTTDAQADGDGGTRLESTKCELPQSKEVMQLRLRKSSNLSSAPSNGPMKALPLPMMRTNSSVGQGTGVELVKSRATSTPICVTERNPVMEVRKEKQAESEGSERKGGKGPSLPSFGSVSSIDTVCPNSLDFPVEAGMSTPEVFRHREKSDGPQITSTPTLAHNINFGTVLGFTAAAPTPIVAPPSKSVFRAYHANSNSSSETREVEGLCLSQDSNKGEIGQQQNLENHKEQEQESSLNQEVSTPVSDEKELPSVDSSSTDKMNDNIRVCVHSEGSGVATLGVCEKEDQKGSPEIKLKEHTTPEKEEPTSKLGSSKESISDKTNLNVTVTNTSKSNKEVQKSLRTTSSAANRSFKTDTKSISSASNTSKSNADAQTSLRRNQSFKIDRKNTSSANTTLKSNTEAQTSLRRSSLQAFKTDRKDTSSANNNTSKSKTEAQRRVSSQSFRTDKKDTTTANNNTMKCNTEAQTLLRRASNQALKVEGKDAPGAITSTSKSEDKKQAPKSTTQSYLIKNKKELPARSQPHKPSLVRPALKPVNGGYNMSLKPRLSLKPPATSANKVADSKISSRKVPPVKLKKNAATTEPVDENRKPDLSSRLKSAQPASQNKPTVPTTSSQLPADKNEVRRQGKIGTGIRTSATRSSIPLPRSKTLK